MKILAIVILSLLGICFIGGVSYAMWLGLGLWWGGLAVITGACIITAALVWSVRQVVEK